MEKLFKAKRLDNGEWHEFLLEEINPTMIENVNTDIICQYTGIDAKNGRIFEGDEVEDNAGDKCIVYFNNRLQQTMLKYSLSECQFKNYSVNQLTLTGNNIHDRG